MLTHKEFDTRFFEPRISTQPLILKYPYIYIVIFPHTYTIAIDSYKITQETIKKAVDYAKENNIKLYKTNRGYIYYFKK